MRHCCLYVVSAAEGEIYLVNVTWFHCIILLHLSEIHVSVDHVIQGVWIMGNALCTNLFYTSFSKNLCHIVIFLVYHGSVQGWAIIQYIAYIAILFIVSHDFGLPILLQWQNNIIVLLLCS